MLRRVVVGSAIAAGSWYAFYRLTRWHARWGRTAGEAAMVLPGDELVPEPTTVDTRAITIDAPPEAVWPWLVQMGYGRAGWYSYDRLDKKGRSADRIDPEWQALSLGETIPTDPGGGFEVRVLAPPRSLVLAVDDAVLAARRQAPGVELDTPGLAASGAMLGTAMPPQFRVSWAFVLEPVEGGRTRLLERVRAWYGEGGGPATTLMGPLLGFGVFVMMHRQMLGIRERAERLAAGKAGPGTPAPATEAAVTGDELTVVANGHAPELIATPKG